MNRGGFSIIEIVITITVLGILLTLGVVSMNATQINARDAERKSDVEAIAMEFENYYKSDMDGGDSPGAEGEYFMSGGSYPGYAYMYQSFFNRAFPEADLGIFRAPGVSNDQPVSIIAATNAVQTTSGVRPQPTLTTYVYQPLTDTNSLCMDPFMLMLSDGRSCIKFNLYYQLEKDNSIHMITSRNQ